MNKQIVILVGSNSVHTLRYLIGISNFVNNIVFITNNTNGLELPSNVVVHVVNFSLYNISARFQIAKIITNYEGSVIHIQQANSYAYHTLKAIKGKNFKTILTAWGSDILLLPKQSYIFANMIKFNLANSDIITSDSLYMSFKIKELYPKIKELHTINFGIQNIPANITDLSVKENIIISNRLHKKLYNIDKIISAFAKIVTKYPEYKLVIVANGTETMTLKSLGRSLGLKDNQIIFTGMLSYSELINWYQRAKYFISIPTSDSTSSSLLEALAYGCYPILSNLPANIEWVMDEINGIINQNPDNLDIDMIRAINLGNNILTEAIKFNYNLIKRKAVFTSNIQKFISLYK